VNIYIYQNEEQVGPFSEEEMKAKVASGEIQPDEQAWTEEKGEWAALNSIIEIEETGESSSEVEAEAAHPYPHLLSEDQDPKLVIKMVERAAGLLTRDETIELIAIQKHPVINISPGGIILTNKRIMAVHPKLTGMTFEDYLWRDVVDVHISEQMLTATFSCSVSGGNKMEMDHLPKKQARRLYSYAQEKEEEMIEVRRERSMEEQRAGAANFSGGAPAKAAPKALPKGAPKNAFQGAPKAFPKQKATSSGFDLFAANEESSQEDSLTTSHSADQEDPVATLEKLKRMLDGGLIEAHEYETKKTEILNRM
jgi:ribosomal protein S19